MEPLWNIVSICSSCAQNQKEQTQKNLIKLLKDSEAEVKSNVRSSVCVKLAFSEEDSIEHMWVNVNKIDYENRVIEGYLDNTPYLINNIGYLDPVECNFDDIEEVL